MKLSTLTMERDLGVIVDSSIKTSIKYAIAIQKVDITIEFIRNGMRFTP